MSKTTVCITSLPDNILHLPEYRILGTKMEEQDLHFQVEAPVPVAYEGCGVEGQFVRFGKRDVAYRDLPIHGKRVSLWVVRRRYTCRACGKTFRPALPEMVDDHRMTRRLYSYVEKEAFNHPYAYVADTTGLDEKTVREVFKKKTEFRLGATMTYSMSAPKPEQNFGVDLSTFWEDYKVRRSWEAL